jgi:hypothetical protein
MIYIDKDLGTFIMALTLGSADTTNPPTLRVIFKRKGTNETVTLDVNPVDITTGNHYIRITNQPTTIFKGSGQYDYTVYDYDVPASPVEIESGLCVVQTNPITLTAYGTDKQRGENK